MHVKVVPIAKTAINTNAWLQIIQHALGYNPCKGCDSENVEAGSSLGWLTTIASLTEIIKPSTFLGNPDPAVMEHLHYSFIVISDEIISGELSHYTSLTVSAAPFAGGELLVVSGSLSTFYLSFFRLSCKGSNPTPRVRYAISEMASTLNRDGFSRLWRRDSTGLIRVS